MISKKRILIILLFIGALLIVFFSFNVRDKTFKLMGDITLFIPGKYGSENLYGLTDTGKIYSYNYKERKVDVILEESDIIFCKIKQKNLIIHRDGSIYIDGNGGFEGELLGKIEGAISGDISNNHIAIITNTGQLYIYGHNKWGGRDYNILGTGDKQKLDQFTLINFPESIIKVDCGLDYTFILSNEGKLYATGVIYKYYSEFTGFNIEESYADIQSNMHSIFFLKENGGISYYALTQGEHFYKINNPEIYNRDFISLSVGVQNALGVTNSGEVYYWGRDIHNPDDISILVDPIKVKGISGAKEVYCTMRYAYIIKEDTILCMPLERQNKIMRFLHYIFGPHYK